MDIAKIRNASKENKLETLIEEVWECNQDDVARHLASLELKLKATTQMDFRTDSSERISIVKSFADDRKIESTVIETEDGKVINLTNSCDIYYGVYDFLADYLGIGEKPASSLNDLEYKYADLKSINGDLAHDEKVFSNLAEGILSYIKRIVDGNTNKNYTEKNFSLSTQ